MRKIFFTALFFLVLCSCAFADAILYRGADNIGIVRTIEEKGNVFVPVSDVARIMGFSSSRTGEELRLSRGSNTIRVIVNSGAAWLNMSIIPLQSAPFERDKIIWLDTYSAANLFQRIAGTGSLNRLRFNVPTAVRASTTPRYSQNEGTFDEPAPAPTQAQTVAQTPTPTPTPAPVRAQPAPARTQTQTVAQTPAPVPTPAPVRAQPAPAPTPTRTQTVAQTPMPVPTPEPAQAQTESDEFFEIPDETTLPELENTQLAVSKKSQPRYVSFKPTDKREKTKEENYSGEIKAIRWTSQEGKIKKIRAVVEVDEEADPQVFMSGGSLHALFSSQAQNAEGIASPFENVHTEINKTEKGQELIFTAENFTKADKTILSNPKRIAFDFFFPESIKFVAVNSQPKEPAPTVETPPVVAAIPATPLIVEPAKPREKIIVIDPGHGGKDPGTSANGVTEKDVNLSIGLMLGRILRQQGYNVIMTRADDTYLKLQERTDIANNAKADLFVSIHVNALPSRKSTSGFEIYIMALPTDKDAMELAKVENREYIEGIGYDTENVDRRTELLLKILGDMQQNNKISESTDFAASLYNAGVVNNLPMKRVAQAPFFVLRGAGMPAVLLETGFVTNAEEAARLSTPEYQAYIAGAMAIGISNYLK